MLRGSCPYAPFPGPCQEDPPWPDRGRKETRTLPGNAPIQGDNAARRRRIPRLVLEFPPAMNPRLEQLIHLQRVESELRRTQPGMAELPKRKAELEAALAAHPPHLEP